MKEIVIEDPSGKLSPEDIAFMDRSLQQMATFMKHLVRKKNEEERELPDDVEFICNMCVATMAAPLAHRYTKDQFKEICVAIAQSLHHHLIRTRELMLKDGILDEY